MAIRNRPAGLAHESAGRILAVAFLFTVAAVGTLLTIVNGWATLTFDDGPDVATVMALIGLISISATGWLGGYALVKHRNGALRTLAAAMSLLNGVILVAYAAVSMVDAANPAWNEKRTLVLSVSLMVAAVGIAFLATAWHLRPKRAVPTEQ